jgi:hypothetical protein
VSEQDVPCPDPDQVVTRSILREELDKLLPTLATKEDLKALATKEDLKAYVTKEDLKAFAVEVAGWFRAMEESILAKVDAMFDPFRDLHPRTTALESTTAVLDGRVGALEARRPVSRPRRKPARNTKRRRPSRK